MSIDGELRSLFHDKLRQGAHFQAVETGGTGLGIPDSNVCFLLPDGTGSECWIEFKKTSAWSVDLQPEQCSWHRTRTARGGRTFVAVRRQHDGGPRKGGPCDELWLYNGKFAQELRSLGLRASPGCHGVWSGGPAQWDWGEIRRILVG